VPADAPAEEVKPVEQIVSEIPSFTETYRAGNAVPTVRVISAKSAALKTNWSSWRSCAMPYASLAVIKTSCSSWWARRLKMAKPKTHQERTLIIAWIIEMVKQYGRATTKDISAMFGLHRTTAEKYIRIAIKQGELIRHGRSGIFRDQRAVIDFDMERYTHRGASV
jgi:hypothetical protein